MKYTKWLLILLFATVLLLPMASAYDRIQQGSAVYINDTYDISGSTGWATQIAYYGEYTENPSGLDPIKIYDLPRLSHTSTKSQYYYWIDPSMFSQYPGRWFQYYGSESDTSDEHGNLEAFYVYTTKPLYLNGTPHTPQLVNVTIVKVIPQRPLPEKRVSDYLIARGDRFNISVGQNTNIWLFGRIDGLYNYRSTGREIVINESIIQGFETGAYTVLLQTMKDPLGYFTVKFDSKTNEINYFDANSFTINKLRIDGLSPQVVIEKLKAIFPYSKDNFISYTLEVQDPVVTIASIDRKYLNKTSVLDVRGYTNVAPGTKIWLVFDEEEQTPRTLQAHTYTGEALGNFDGNMRQYQILIPFDPENTADGIHPITAHTAIGGSAIYDLPVFSYPADSYKPNETVRYIADRNPWVPPVVVTVTVPVPGPTQIIYQQLTPSVDQIRTEAQKLVDKQNATTAATIVSAVMVCFVAGFVAWFLWSVRRAGK